MLQQHAEPAQEVGESERGNTNADDRKVTRAKEEVALGTGYNVRRSRPAMRLSRRQEQKEIQWSAV